MAQLSSSTALAHLVEAGCPQKTDVTARRRQSHACHVAALSLAETRAGRTVDPATETASGRKSPVRGLRPYRVERIGEPEVVVASFDSLHAAIRHIATLPLNQQHVVIWRGKVVWPGNVRRNLKDRL